MKLPRILLLGKNGQLGWALRRALAIRSELIGIDRSTCDLSFPDQLRSVVRESRPDVIVNAAAYTAVDQAESEGELAHRVNAVAPGILAEEAKQIGALLIHYSTDYVFDGQKNGFYNESDVPTPINLYGRSKLFGEEAIRSVGGTYIIYRTCWAYGLFGNNFPKKILALARECESLRVVCDQIGAPTSVDLIADVTSLCLDKFIFHLTMRESFSGVYHLAPRGEISRHGLARELVWRALDAKIPLKISLDRVEAVGTNDYPMPAKRPSNSRLGTAKLEETFGLLMPPWQFHIDRLIKDIASAREIASGTTGRGLLLSKREAYLCP